MIISQLRCALSLSKGQLARFDKLSAHPPQLAASPPILIAVVPILIAYIFLQRWIVGGLTAGATKG